MIRSFFFISQLPDNSVSTLGVHFKAPLNFTTGPCLFSPTLTIADKNNYSDFFLKEEGICIRINRQDSLQQDYDTFKQKSRWLFSASYWQWWVPVCIFMPLLPSCSWLQVCPLFWNAARERLRRARGLWWLSNMRALSSIKDSKFSWRDLGFEAPHSLGACTASEVGSSLLLIAAASLFGRGRRV